MDDFEFDQVRYLAAKKSVDDRALNRHVWERLVAEISGRPTATSALAIVELGAGIGTMVERLADWGLFDAVAAAAPSAPRLSISIDLVDSHRPSVDAAAARLPTAGRRRGWAVTPSPSGCRWWRAPLEVDVRLHCRDIVDFVAEGTVAHGAGAGRGRAAGRGGGAQLVIAQALLDLFDLDEVVPLALGLLEPGGLLYAPITFDGMTIFEPTVAPAVDAAIRASYHEVMDRRITAGRRSGDAQAGRHLYHAVSSHGADVLDVGGSDWVVFPTAGRYRDDEAYFLRCILATMAGALHGGAGVRAEVLAEWMGRRRAQVDAGELVYIAHQLDLLARRPPA